MSSIGTRWSSASTIVTSVPNDFQTLANSTPMTPPPTAAMQSILPQTFELIDEGKQVLDTARATAPEFKQFAQGLADLTETLRTSDPDIRKLFDNGVQAARELEGPVPPGRYGEVTLDALALRMAEQASATGQRVELEPMTAVERKIVHEKLKDDPEVETASEGTEPNRFVVIFPRNVAV